VSNYRTMKNYGVMDTTFDLGIRWRLVFYPILPLGKEHRNHYIEGSVGSRASLLL
jgi:hypothetical protein